MTSWIKRLTAIVIASSVTFLTACGGGDDAADVVTLARSNPDLSVLAEAIDAAGLAPTLQGAGPFTVFAPTNQAFTNVLAELKLTKEQLFADKPLSTAVLTYHVVSGKVMAKDVKAGKVKTVQGGELTLATTGGVTVNGAKVISADVVADNGVIHVIDTVVLPK